ncbi:MAG: hypothetical protein AUH86_06595 [Acidobacteria bacterium 13_1_40CM_4_58_4]|nr:MAG: hypothetical protein AUH86_06595 [Acidobacteria bacterium 13_1_40CM_4_58_4]
MRGATRAGGKKCGRSNGERFTGGWKGAARSGAGFVAETGGRNGCTGRLGEASTGASAKGR